MEGIITQFQTEMNGKIMQLQTENTGLKTSIAYMKTLLELQSENIELKKEFKKLGHELEKHTNLSRDSHTTFKEHDVWPAFVKEHNTRPTFATFEERNFFEDYSLEHNIWPAITGGISSSKNITPEAKTRFIKTLEESYHTKITNSAIKNIVELEDSVKHMETCTNDIKKILERIRQYSNLHCLEQQDQRTRNHLPWISFIH